jgi:hypothetical protein
MRFRRWLHRRGWLYSPSTDLIDAFKSFDYWPSHAKMPTAYDNCPPAASHTCGECNRRVPNPVVITYVQRIPLPKLPTVITFCCREYIAPAFIPGMKCVHCGERPTYLRDDVPQLEQELALT